MQIKKWKNPELWNRGRKYYGYVEISLFYVKIVFVKYRIRSYISADGKNTFIIVLQQEICHENHSSSNRHNRNMAEPSCTTSEI